MDADIVVFPEPVRYFYEKRMDTGTVYLLGDTGREGVYKIGVTRGDVTERIRKLQTGNSGEIYMVMKYETDSPFLMESMLHRRYCGENVRNEWFSLSDEDVVEFRKTCGDIQAVIDSLRTNSWHVMNGAKKRKPR